MKKVFVFILAICAVLVLLTGCGNYQLLDTTYRYDKAIIKLANDEVVEVDIKSWADYDGEQLQIVATDGTIYLTNSFRCDLIREGDGK